MERVAVYLRPSSRLGEPEIMKTIIIGGVAGGASCAARLSRLDETAEIIMVEKGPYVSYANCGLPYHVGGVIDDEASLLVANPELFRSQFAVDVRTGTEAVAIDPSIFPASSTSAPSPTHARYAPGSAAQAKAIGPS